MNAPSLSPSHLFQRLFKGTLLKLPFAIALLGLILIPWQIAFAATYTVTNTADSGAGSLRDAINQVNAGTGGDTINFSGVTGTITVSSQIVISKTVTINGPGANILAVSGGDVTRIFQIGSGAANTVLSGLTITHGNATHEALSLGQGGAMQTAAAIILNNCTFSYNVAGGGAINQGGAIEGSTGAVTVNGSTFFNNTATTGDGGAIQTAGNVLVNNSTFYNNTAALQGGAIWTQLGTRLTVRNSTIVGNTASTLQTPNEEGGGGIWTNSPITVTNSIISGNTSVAGGGPDYLCNVTVACGGINNPQPANNLIGDATVTSLLTPLQYNGGGTQTMAPLVGQTGIIGAGLEQHTGD